LSLRITLLGTGTSHGVPMIGCACAVCQSTDPRDRRSRPSILIENLAPALPDPGAGGRVIGEPRRILVDTSTDLRSQALAGGVSRVDAILFTHGHADHIMGFDDIRRYNVMQRQALPCYADARTASELRRTFSYIFSNGPHVGGGVPEVTLFEIGGPFTLGGMEIVPVPVMHGPRPILGFRVGTFAYLTDCNQIPDASWPLLAGTKMLVLDALRHRPHPTHFSLGEALAVVERLSPERAWFTHICHDLPHAATCAQLPAGVELAYDGLVIDLDGIGGGSSTAPAPAAR
jgi:phosphoribosyl 1,2-cyclic phosphate phosphodiesterase